MNNLREAGSTEGHGATGSPADPQSREDDSPAVLDSLKEPPWDTVRAAVTSAESTGVTAPEVGKSGAVRHHLHPVKLTKSAKDCRLSKSDLLGVVYLLKET